MLTIVSSGVGGFRWSVGHCERSTTVGGWGSLCVATGGRATGGLPRHPTVCICIGVVLGVHVCGSYPAGGRWGEGGGWVVFDVRGVTSKCALRGWVVYLCVSTTLADGWLVATSFIAPPSSV